MTLTRRSALQSFAVVMLASAEGWAGVASRRRRPSRDETDEFLAAVRGGDRDRVQALLQRTPSLAGSRDAEGVSALALACFAGHDAIVQDLRDTGLVLDVAEAAMVGDWPRFEQLVQAQPELCHALHPVGGTPLYAAARAGGSQLFRVRSAGCRPDDAPPGGSGWTPARAAMDAPDLHDAWAVATDLLGNGSHANVPQRDGDSVLHGAVRRRSERLVRLAVRKHADVTARDREGRTAAELAEQLGWAEGAALLHDHAALPRDHRASRFAVDAGRAPITRPDLSDLPQELQSQITGQSHTNLAKVRELVGQDRRRVFSISTDDELAIEASAHIGNRDIMRFHLDQGAPYSLPTAVSMGDEEHARFLLDEDPELIHERGAHDFPVLWYVALGGASPDLAALLCEEYDVPPDQDSVGTTTLHWCVRRGRRDLAEWLVDAGADVNAVSYSWDRAGLTPLAMARQVGDRDLVQLLERAGARG